MLSAFTIIKKINLDLRTGESADVFALCSSSITRFTPIYSLLHEGYRSKWTPDEQMLKDFIAGNLASDEDHELLAAEFGVVKAAKV